MDRIQPRDGPHNEPTPLDQKLFEHMGRDAALRIGPPGFRSMTSRSNGVPSSSHAMQLGPHNEPTPLDQKLFEHMERDAALRIGPPGFRSMTSRSNGVPSSSHAMQLPGHRVGNQGTSHVSFVPYHPGRSSSHVPYDTQPKPAPSYPHGSEDFFAPVSSHVDGRNVAVKRKNPADGINAGDYYVGSSSNSRLSSTVQPNPTARTEPLLPQMPLSIGRSNWNDQRLVNQEGSQRNVRARHDRANIPVEPRPGSASTSTNNHMPPLHSAASAFQSTSAERNNAPFPLPTATLPSGASGITGRASTGRLHLPAMHSSSSSVAAAPTVYASSDTAIFANGAYAAPRAVHGGTVPSYTHPLSAASSSSRAVSHDAVIPSYPPAAQSIRINNPSPIATTASTTQARHVSMAHANSGRNRAARSSYFGIHPLMVDAQRLLMLETQLALIHQSRQAAVDPHRDLRLNIDEMSYEELLALEETIGNVNTGVAEEKISGCVKEVVCCGSDLTEDDEEDGRCLVCLEGYKDNDNLGILKCGHDFHTDCIKKWLQVKNACPVCKQAAAA